MSPQRWRKVRQVFEQAADCPPDEAERVLRDACGADSNLYDEVRRMLAEHERSSPLDRAVWERANLGVFRAGQMVAGRYFIVRYLNRGGMGEVYEARDEELGERVALKTVLPEIAADARMIARFKQEIQLSRKIAHPNVCRVFDLARHPADGSSPDTVFFLTMEFLDGETLSARLERDGRMSPEQALPLLEQMALALDAAHTAGVIHRDFKPSNVMLVERPGSPTPRVVVTDFGLARSMTLQESTVSLSGGVIGTVDYMAPELLTGAQATFASDIYALGLVAHKMITGALPFACDTPLAAAILRSKEPIPSPRAFVPGLDPRWDRAILRALSTNPAGRFSTASEFIRALRGEQSGITFALPEMTRRRWMLAGAVVIVAVGGMLGWRASIAARHRLNPEAESLYRKGVDDIAAGAYYAATRALGQAIQHAPDYAMAHARLAEAWVELEMPERAQQEMLLARREDTSGLSELDRLHIEAIDLTITRDFSKAAAKYERIAALAGPSSADAAVDLGRAWDKAGQPDRAVEAYRKAAEGPAHNPAAWLKLGVLYSRGSKAAESEAAFRQAESIYQLSSNLEGLTELEFQRGIAANRRGQWAEGATHLTRSLDTAHMAGNTQKEVSVKLQLATNAYRSGNREEAERLSSEALREAQESQIEPLAIAGLVNLGNAYMLKPDFAGAERYYQEALGLARRNSLPRFVALSLLSLAALHDYQKQPDQAVQEASEAQRFFEPNHWVQETFLCLTILSRAEEARGNYAAQLASAQRLLDGVTKMNVASLTGSAHESLALALSNLDRYPEALEHFQEFAARSTDATHIGYGAIESGETLSTLGRFGEAREMFDKAEPVVANDPMLQARLRQARAECELRQGHAAAAESLVRRALAGDPKADTRGMAETYRILCLSQASLGQGSQAVASCRKALDILTGQHRPKRRIEAQQALGGALLVDRKRDEAMAVLREIEPQVADQPELRWRTLALIASVDRQYRAAADALAALSAQWGSAAMTAYLKRSDVVPLARPLLALSSAKK
jgi:tetratricopeptide (TPR) repeat protein